MLDSSNKLLLEVDKSRAFNKNHSTIIKSFVWKNIIYRFTILIDNGLQFTSSEVTDWLKKLGIYHLSSILRYPHSNDEIDTLNKTIMQCLKKIIEKKSKWLEELLGVL